MTIVGFIDRPKLNVIGIAQLKQLYCFPHRPLLRISQHFHLQSRYTAFTMSNLTDYIDFSQKSLQSKSAVTFIKRQLLLLSFPILTFPLRFKSPHWPLRSIRSFGSKQFSYSRLLAFSKFSIFHVVRKLTANKALSRVQVRLFFFPRWKSLACDPRNNRYQSTTTTT